MNWDNTLETELTLCLFFASDICILTGHSEKKNRKKQAFFSVTLQMHF